MSLLGRGPKASCTGAPRSVAPQLRHSFPRFGLSRNSCVERTRGQDEQTHSGTRQQQGRTPCRTSSLGSWRTTSCVLSSDEEMNGARRGHLSRKLAATGWAIVYDVGDRRWLQLFLQVLFGFVRISPSKSLICPQTMFSAVPLHVAKGSTVQKEQARAGSKHAFTWQGVAGATKPFPSFSCTSLLNHQRDSNNGCTYRPHDGVP